MYLGGVGHVEITEGFFGLTDCLPWCVREGAHRMADEHHRLFWGEVVLPGLGHGGFWILY